MKNVVPRCRFSFICIYSPIRNGMPGVPSRHLTTVTSRNSNCFVWFLETKKKKWELSDVTVYVLPLPIDVQICRWTRWPRFLIWNCPHFSELLEVNKSLDLNQNYSAAYWTEGARCLSNTAAVPWGIAFYCNDLVLSGVQDTASILLNLSSWIFVKTAWLFRLDRLAGQFSLQKSTFELRSDYAPLLGTMMRYQIVG